MGYQILAVSPDRPEKLAETQGQHELAYKLLSDSKMTAAKAFGIAYEVDDKTVKALDGFGVDLNKYSGEEHHVLPVPAVFLVGTDGTVDFHYVNRDYRIRMNADVLLAAAKAELSDK
jgi:peroxiredoxin